MGSEAHGQVRHKSYLTAALDRATQQRGSTVTETTLPKREDLELGKVLSALADPNRRRVVLALLQEPVGTERTCVSFELPVTKATSTFHFRVLREAGLTYDLSYGNRKGVSLRRDDIDARFPGLLAALASAR
jgi:DNA-binding transcriptional ArsR family regulator